MHLERYRTSVSKRPISVDFLQSEFARSRHKSTQHQKLQDTELGSRCLAMNLGVLNFEAVLDPEDVGALIEHLRILEV